MGSLPLGYSLSYVRVTQRFGVSKPPIQSGDFGPAATRAVESLVVPLSLRGCHSAVLHLRWPLLIVTLMLPTVCVGTLAMKVYPNGLPHASDSSASYIGNADPPIVGTAALVSAQNQRGGGKPSRSLAGTRKGQVVFNGTAKTLRSHSLRRSGDRRRFVSYDHRQPTPHSPQPIEHRAEQQQDRQRAHRPGGE